MTRLRELREERKLSQQRLAMELNITQAMISKYELGATEPGSTMLKHYAKFFGVTTDYILELSDNKIVIEANLNDDERKLLTKYRLIDTQGKVQTQGYLDGLLENRK